MTTKVDYGAIKVTVEGSQELAKKIREWNFKSYRNAIRASMARGAAIVRDDLKGTGSPIWSGMLRKAWAVKNSKYTSQNVYSLVGARRRTEGFRVPAKRQAAAKRLHRMGRLPKNIKRQRPTRYLHLVERGHKGRGGRGFVPGKFFMQNALARLSPQVQNRVKETLRERLARFTDQSDQLNIE